MPMTITLAPAFFALIGHGAQILLRHLHAQASKRIVAPKLHDQNMRLVNLKQLGQPAKAS